MNLITLLFTYKITILARRPRGLRAKINLASKEMSVIFGGCRSAEILTYEGKFVLFEARD